MGWLNGAFFCIISIQYHVVLLPTCISFPEKRRRQEGRVTNQKKQAHFTQSHLPTQGDYMICACKHKERCAPVFPLLTIIIYNK
jgi:hypothetical protein